MVTRISRREAIGLGAGAALTAALPPGASAAEPSAGVLKIDARPAEVRFDPGRSAMLVIDMQNDFGSKGGMFERAGIDITGIQRVVAPTARALEAARKAGIPVYYLMMAYKPDLSDLGAPDSVNRARHLRLGVGNPVTAPDGSPSRILVRDTWNTGIIDALKPEADDVVIVKTRFSGFFHTDLHERLQARGARHLFVTGCTTSICVESTVRDAMFRDYLCVLLEDCMSEPIGDGLPRSNHAASLLSTEVLLGWVSDSGRFASALGAA
jgi:ureidoacrylate peracid hydrolase